MASRTGFGADTSLGANSTVASPGQTVIYEGLRQGAADYQSDPPTPVPPDAQMSVWAQRVGGALHGTITVPIPDFLAAGLENHPSAVILTCQIRVRLPSFRWWTKPDQWTSHLDVSTFLAGAKILYQNIGGGSANRNALWYVVGTYAAKTVASHFTVTCSGGTTGQPPVDGLGFDLEWAVYGFNATTHVSAPPTLLSADQLSLSSCSLESGPSWEEL